MNRQPRSITGTSGKANQKLVRMSLENDSMLTSGDSALFDTISEYMKGRLDFEEVRNDPGLPAMESAVKEMISDYNKNKRHTYDDEKFISDIFAGGISDEKLLDEISHIKYEISSSNVNDISAEWVKEWHEKRQRNGSSDSKSDEIRDFIKTSLETEKREPEIILTGEVKKGLSKSLLVRYISLSAAAVLTTFILVRTLLPSYSPEKIFNSYYEPLNAISPVTRSVNSDKASGYASAIESYKHGDYQTAAMGFSDVIMKDPSVIAPRFFMGVTQVALGDYNQAINLLSDVSGLSGEYGKEARWYLGLAYLKTGEKEKALECFELLSQNPGFYSGRAEKILRRLK